MAVQTGAQNSVAMDPTSVDTNAVRINGGTVNNTARRGAIQTVLGWEVYAPPSANILVAWGGRLDGVPPAYTFNPGATDLVQAGAGTANGTRVPAGGSITLLGDGDIWAIRETGSGAVTVNCRAFF